MNHPPNNVFHSLTHTHTGSSSKKSNKSVTAVIIVVSGALSSSSRRSRAGQPRRSGVSLPRFRHFFGGVVFFVFFSFHVCADGYLSTPQSLLQCHPAGIGRHTALNIPESVSEEARSLLEQVAVQNTRQRNARVKCSV